MASRQMEGMKQIMKQMMQKDGMPSFHGAFDYRKLRMNIERAQSNMYVEPGTLFERLDLGGVPGEVCIPKGGSDKAVIIYIHGGGLICGTAESSRGYASLIATETGFRTYTLSYRLAPEHKFPAAIDDCFEAYRTVLKRHPENPIFLIGESGGGYLCLTTVLKTRDAGLRLPNGIIPYSPVVDMNGFIDRKSTNPNDFTVSSSGLDTLRDLYLPAGISVDPLSSPILADFKGFPPILLAWDDSETLAADSIALKKKAQEAGVEVFGKGYPDCFHAFATTGKGTPESNEVLNETVAFIRQHLK